MLSRETTFCGNPRSHCFRITAVQVRTKVPVQLSPPTLGRGDIPRSGDKSIGIRIADKIG